MKDLNYSATRKSVKKFLITEEQNKSPTAHLEEGFKIDSGFWSDYGTELNAWLLKK